MDNDTSTPTSGNTDNFLNNNIDDLPNKLWSTIAIPVDLVIPTSWFKSIVVTEFKKMLVPYINNHPEHRDILWKVLFRDFIQAYRNEKDNHANPFVDDEKRLKWDGMHQRFLEAKTIDECCDIVKKSAEEGFEFKKEYLAALNITKKLKEMKAKGMLEHAMEELVFVCYFNKNISLSRELEHNERESKIKFLIRAEKRYKKLESFIDYLHEIEDEWHKTKEENEEKTEEKAEEKTKGKKGMKNAVEKVFMKNAENEDFINLFEQHFNLNIKDEHDADVAKRKLERMVDNYTKLWYEVNDGVSRNGHKRQRRRPHPDRVKKMIGESVRKAHAQKNKDKIGNRSLKSGNRGRKKKL